MQYYQANSLDKLHTHSHIYIPIVGIYLNSPLCDIHWKNPIVDIDWNNPNGACTSTTVMQKFTGTALLCVLDSTSRVWQRQ